MSEQKVVKRGWVKNAAIIFLAVLLALTFFSNTIMNRSLPEVAVQYVQSGTITTKIRGSGTVEANSVYEVTFDQTRKVESVLVKTGDTVVAGDVLFVLADTESDELQAARDTLDDMTLQYRKALINATDTAFPKETRAITAAEADLAEAVAERDANVVSDARLADAEDEVDSLTAKVKDLEKDLAALGGSNSTDSQLVSLRNQITAKKQELSAAEDALAAAKLVHGAAYEALKEIAQAAMAADTSKPDSQKKLSVYLAAEAQKLEDTDPMAIAYSTITGYEEDISAARSELAQLQDQYDDALDADNTYEYSKIGKKLDAAQEDLAAATKELTQLQDQRTAWKTAVATVKTCEDNLQSLTEALESAHKNAQIEGLDLEAMKKDLAKQQQLVSDLAADTVEAKVTAPQAGIVTAINVTAGSDTAAGTPLAVIEAPDLGYSLSFAVTPEQSKKVKVGDAAEVYNYYWGPEIKATLSQIKNDPSNPGRSKLLVFSLSGEVETGSTLTLSIAQQSANYDMIVPNSAIRSDSNGDFVLTIVAKSTPLGNRYIATRVDVQVLATDDTNTAVMGGLSQWGDYVITTANKPVEPGMQVRMAE